jgi:hypothetical protein
MTGAIVSPEQKAVLRRGQAALLKVIDERMDELKNELRSSPFDAKAWEAMVHYRRFRAAILRGSPEPIQRQAEPPPLGVRWLY